MRFVHKVEAVSVSDVERLVKERIRKFFSQDQLPVPKIVVVDNKSAKWLGRTTYKSKEPGTSTIEVQKRILNDRQTLERVIDHELIHHKDFTRNPTDPTQKDIRRNPHDEFFMKEARRVSQKVGKPAWITKKSDQTFVVDSIPKEMTVILYNNNGKYGFTYTFQPTAEQKKALKDLFATNKARVLKSHDNRFTSGPVLTEQPQFAIPKDKKMQDYLRDLYKTASKTL